MSYLSGNYQLADAYAGHAQAQLVQPPPAQDPRTGGGGQAADVLETIVDGGARIVDSIASVSRARAQAVSAYQYPAPGTIGSIDPNLLILGVAAIGAGVLLWGRQ